MHVAYFGKIILNFNPVPKKKNWVSVEVICTKVACPP